jgi:hypothetical protein
MLFSKPAVALALLALCACSQSPNSAPSPRPEAGTVAVPQADAPIQQVAYEADELRRRLIAVADGLNTFPDLSSDTLGSSLGLRLQPEAGRPQSNHAVAALGNGWVYQVRAWQAEAGEPPPGPTQLYFFPGPSADPKWWGSGSCFLDSALLVDDLKQRGFVVDERHRDGELGSIRLSRPGSSAAFSLTIGDYVANPAGPGGQRCLQKMTIKAG